eukprot:10743211-Lingulodinium_polyedra.AAC.1
MLARPGLAALADVYGFAREHRRGPPVALPSGVRAELETLAAIAPLLYTDLELPWGSLVSAVDASDQGYGVASTVASPAETLEAAQWAETRGWA